MYFVTLDFSHISLEIICVCVFFGYLQHAHPTTLPYTFAPVSNLYRTVKLFALIPTKKKGQGVSGVWGCVCVGGGVEGVRGGGVGSFTWKNNILL